MTSQAQAQATPQQPAVTSQAQAQATPQQPNVTSQALACNEVLQEDWGTSQTNAYSKTLSGVAGSPLKPESCSEPPMPSLKSPDILAQALQLSEIHPEKQQTYPSSPISQNKKIQDLDKVIKELQKEIQSLKSKQTAPIIPAPALNASASNANQSQNVTTNQPTQEAISVPCVDSVTENLLNIVKVDDWKLGTIDWEMFKNMDFKFEGV